MDDKPDLSHLTPEERRIIEDVMNRQKQEEAKDAQLVGKSSTIRRQSMKEHVTTTRTAYTTNPSENPSNATIVNGEIVNKLSSTNNTNTSLPFGNAVVNMMTEAVHAVSGNSGSGITGVTGATTGHAANVCEACHKTKFADNSGNLCIYCKRRTCTRCGSHSEIKPNVIQWMCKDCLQSPNISERQQIQSGSNIPDHTNTTVNSITGRLGESIASFISKPKASDTKRHLPQANTTNQNMTHSYEASSGSRLQNAGSGRQLPKPYSANRSNSLDADNTTYISPDNFLYYGDQQRPYNDTFVKYDQTPGEYGHNRSRRISGDYYPSNEFSAYREVQKRYPVDPRLSNNPYLDPLYAGDSFPSDPSDSPCQSGGSVKQSLPYSKASARDYSRYREMRYRSDQHFDSQSPYLTPNYPSGSFGFQRRNVPNWENYRYGAIPPRYRDQLRHHQLHHLSFSSSDGEDFSVVDDGSVPYQEPRRRLLPTNFEKRNSPYSQGTVTDDDDPASQFYISKRSSTPYYDGQLKPYAWDQDRALSLCDEPPKYICDYEAQSEHHRRLPENRTSVSQKDIQYNHEDGTIVTKRKLPKSSSSQPVTWNLSEEGRHLIGHMILRKKTDPHFGEPGSVLGLKLAGGRLDRAGRLCAFVTQIKPGTPADIVGQLRPGDEILEWNGQSLRGLSADEVSQIIYQSKDEIQVELIAQRELSQTENTPTDDVVLMVPSPSECFSRNGIDSEERIPRSSLQMKLFYDEIKRQLIVNVLAAQNLSTIHRPFRGPCAFYCRLCLLPEQEEYNCRCTKLVRGSSNPIWNQAFRFTNLSDNDLNSHHLEVTIWSCVENTDEQHKIGEIVIDLSVADLLDVAYWYPIRSINRFFSTSELSNMNPEVSTGAFDFQQYENQVPEKLIKPRYYEPEQWSPRTIYRDSGNPDDELRKQRSSRDTRNEVRRDDYSDIDEQKFSANSRQNRKYAERDYQQRENEEHHRGSRRHPKNPNYDYGGVDENAIQSDASEFSDLSELSRMSLHTTHSDRHRVESMQMHRAVNQQFQTPTQSRGDRYPQNSQTSSRLDQQFSPSTEQPARIRRDSNRLETETSGLVEERVIPKDSGNSEGGFGQGTSSTGSAGGRDPRIMVENKQSTSEIAQSIERDQVDGRKRRPNIGQKFSHVLGRSSKSSSTSTLDKKSRTSFQRSEEVLPLGGYGAIFEGHEQEGTFANGRSSMVHRQMSIGSGKSDNQNPRCGANSNNTDQESIYMGRNESHVGEFVEGLGPGQLVGRQVLGMPCLGEIQLSFYDRKGHLEVEVIRARGLQQKNTAKPLPAPYVKLHLLEGKQSVEKLRTMYPPRRTLDPLYQQQLSFSVPYHGKILQISVWGEYGRMDKKVFLGMCEIVLDDLDLKTVVFGWYKLFGMIASNAHHHHNPQQKGSSSSSAPGDDSKSSKSNKLSEAKAERTMNRKSRHNDNNNNNNTDELNRTQSKPSQEMKSPQPGFSKNNDGKSTNRSLGSPHSTRR